MKILRLQLYSSLGVAVALLSLALLLQTVFGDNFRGKDLYLENVEQNVSRALFSLNNEAERLQQEIMQGNIRKFPDSRFPYFVYENTALQYWSDCSFTPAKEQINDAFLLRFVETGGSQYVARKNEFSFNGRQYMLLIYLPLYTDYPIENQYLRASPNPDLFYQESVSLKPPESSQQNDHTISFNGEVLFYLTLPDYNREFTSHATSRSFQTLLFIIYLLGLALLMYNFFMHVNRLFFRKNIRMLKGLLYLVSGLLALRVVLLWSGFPQNIIYLPLFDGKYYASSFLHPSLGDLLVNAVIVLIITGYLFVSCNRIDYFRSILRKSRKVKQLTALVVILLCVLATYLHFYFFKTLFLDADWSMDITKSIAFPPLKVVSLLILVINSSAYFLFSHTLIRLLVFLIKSPQTGVVLFFTSTILLAISILVDFPLLYLLTALVIFTSLLYQLNLPRYLQRFSYVSFLYLFTGALLSAVVGAISMYDASNEILVDNKLKFSNQILLKNDILAEYQLHEASKKIAGDLLIKDRMSNPLASREIIKDKIKRYYLSNYFNKYLVTIHIFDKEGVAHDINKPDLVKYRTDYQRPQYATDYPNLYFFNEESSLFPINSGARRYFSFVTVRQYDVPVGHIVIELQPKRIIPDQVYPELFVDRRFTSTYNARQFDYAVYNNRQLQYSTSERAVTLNNIKAELNNTDAKVTETEKNGFHFLVHQVNNKTLVITSPGFGLNEGISNFSFFFLVFVSAILVFLVIFSVYYLIQRVNLNFAAKIQLYLNAAFFMPLLAVSITTLSIISNSYVEAVTNQYLNQASQIGNNVANTMDGLSNPDRQQEALRPLVNRIAKNMELDLNLFNEQGQLIISSQPLIYDNQLLSRYMNYAALQDIRQEGKSAIIYDESVGKLNYKSAYIAIRSFKDGRLMGILSIPFFESRDQLAVQITEILTNIVNIFTFIFIIFLIISYLASTLLTFPLQYITQKLRRTTLSNYNEPLTWDANDEIGLMVSEYNKMLVKLEESKAALAKNEKESAWREMARQVAHEIKNPLTPMKLNLQHLKRKMQHDYDKGIQSDDVPLLSRSISNLIEQVDTLSDIASSFSSFAKMPIPKQERFELGSVVKSAVGLFRGKDCTIHLDIDRGFYIVEGDKQLMSRIINNLLINAQQAVPEPRQPDISVRVQKSDTNVILITIADNGSGIPPEVQKKIFLPNFSTKYTGSGIGLAIAKRGIDHAGGRIWFDTSAEEGTTFYIELPLIAEYSI